MVLRTPMAALLAAAALATAGCGGGDDDPAQDLPDAAVGTTPTFTEPATPSDTVPEGRPSGAPVSDQAWLQALDRSCATSVSAVQELFGASSGPADPIGALGRLARRYRAGIERLATVQPPASRRALHLQVLAEGRESAARLDAAVAAAKRGDVDEAAGVAAELGGLLPDLPADARRGAPACADEIAPG